MALTTTAQTPPVVSNVIPGAGYFVVLTVAWDASYPTGGETWDVSAYGSTVLGAWQIAGTLDDEGFIARYVAAAAGAAATGILQAYWYDYDAVADGLAVEVANTTNLSAANGQVWCVWFTA